MRSLKEDNASESGVLLPQAFQYWLLSNCTRQRLLSVMGELSVLLASESEMDST